MKHDFIYGVRGPQVPEGSVFYKVPNTSDKKEDLK